MQIIADNIYFYYTSPNQKSIITKKTSSNAACPYGICNVSAVLTAATALSDKAFKLYMRMNLHKDGHKYALSPVEIHSSIGMSDKRYRDSVKELIEKGYLVQSEKHSALYMFYEFPQLDNRQSTGLTDSPDTPSDLPDTPSDSDTSSTQNGRMTRPFQTDSPSDSGGEITPDITSHNTDYNTNYNTSDSNNGGNSFIDECNNFFIQIERKRKQREAEAEKLTTFDPDDKTMYEQPETPEGYSEGYNYGFDDGLPF